MVSDDSRFFIIDSITDFITLTPQKIKEVIDYSQQENSNIVEIYHLTANRCVSKFYSELTPMVIIEKNSFYSPMVFLEKSKNYTNFISDYDKVSNLYNKIVDSYVDFSINTGCYFDDMSGNNIMVNSDFSEFRIIDVFSIKKAYPNMSIKFDPWSIMSCVTIKREGNRVFVSGDDTLSNYLSNLDLVQLDDQVFSKIKTREFIFQ